MPSQSIHLPQIHLTPEQGCRLLRRRVHRLSLIIGRIQRNESPRGRQAEKDVSPVARSIEDLLTSLTKHSPDQRLPPISDSPSATYTFSPIWPMEGSLQKAFGMLGKTRDVSFCFQNT